MAEPTAAPSITAATSISTSVAVIDGDAAVAMLTAYFAAYAAGDVDSAMSHFSSDPPVIFTFCFADDDCFVPDGDHKRQQTHLVAHNIAEGVENRDLSCELGEVTAEQALVRCEFVRHIAQALAVEAPGVPNVALATVGPTGIIDYELHTGQPDYSLTFDPFMAWMRMNHPPEAASVECCSWASIEDARAGGEASRRFAQAWATYLEVVGCTESDYECARITNPAGVLEAYVAAYNAGNVDAMMAFFTDDAVILDHPWSRETTGRDALSDLHVEDRAAAAANDPYTISNIAIAGDNVTWDHVWRSRSGEEFCAAGHSATVTNGRITRWQWPTNVGPCQDS